ncbi:MAG: HAD family hydrolase, partial [Crocosphaera sp.]
MVTISCGVKQFTNIESIMLDKDGTLENSPNFSQKLAHERASLIESYIKKDIRESLLKAWGIRDNIFDLTGLMAVGSREENAIVAAAYVAQRGYSWSEARQIVDRAFEQAHKH